MDGWAGYPANRERLLRAIEATAKNRTVVLTGDVHSNWVHELKGGFDRPDRPVVGAEFVGTSIASGGDGEDAWRGSAEAMPENPHVKWHTARRGYMVCDVRPDAWTTAYREVPFVSRPGAPVTTASTWRVEHGKPGLTKV
jgi:alkaline phosphatase D